MKGMSVSVSDFKGGKQLMEKISNVEELEVFKKAHALTLKM